MPNNQSFIFELNPTTLQTSFFIAQRYFFAQKKKNVINIISTIAMIGVAIGTAALVVVMSAFNGLEALTLSQFNAFYADLKIMPAKGKTFEVNDSLLQTLRKIEGVQAITEVIEDNALVRYGDVQAVVVMKGVSSNFEQQYDLRSKLLTGQFLIEQNNRAYMIVGAGILSQLSIDLGNELKPLLCWYPKRQKNVQLDPEKAFKKLPILASGAVAVEQQFDNQYVFVPLSFAEELTQYYNRRTALEVKAQGGDKEKVQQLLQTQLGNNFIVKTREEQQASILRAVQIERLFVFIAFSFVLAIASFNIFFSLTMLAIEKRKDVAVLFSLGATPNTVRNIFLYEGSIIAVIGAVVGLLLGYSICFAQKQWGFVKLGLTNSQLEAYPVEMLWTDFVSIATIITVITFFAAFFPAQKATKVKMNEEL